MTVKKMIDILQKFPPELQLFKEFSDEWVGIDIMDYTTQEYIEIEDYEDRIKQNHDVRGVVCS